MNITIQHTESCPNLEKAEARLREALRQSATTAEIQHEVVTTPEEASRLGFTGSPTILIDGRDPFVRGDGQPAVACRIYRTDQGHDGAPSVEDLCLAITAAAKTDDD